MSHIHFTATIYTIDSWNIVSLPQGASAKLPSRGLVMVNAAIDSFEFQTALEPDGKGSHWFQVDAALHKATGLDTGDTVTLDIEPTKAWPEPKVPADISHGISANPQAHATWEKVTPMARWEWIRWIRATNNVETRQRRIEVACSKLKSGMRRPCCFNASMCTEPTVSKNGVLLEPLHATNL